MKSHTTGFAPRSEFSPAQIWTPQLIWPLAGIVAGGLAALWVSPWLGAVIFTLAYIACAGISLPVAMALYILSAPFPLGMVLHHHHFFVSDLMAVIMLGRLLWAKRENFSLRSLSDLFLPREFRNPLLALLALSILSLAVALSHSGTVIKILEYVEFFVVVVAIGKWSGTRKQVWTLYLSALILAVAVVVLVGLVQYLWALGPQSNQINLHHVRATGFFGQPNPFGAFAGETFPLILGLIALGPEGIRHNRWLQAGLVLAALGSVESYSRGAWVGDVVAVCAMGLAIYTTRGISSLKRFAYWGIGAPVAMFVLIVLLGKTNLSHQHWTQVWVQANTSAKIKDTFLHPQQSYDTKQRFLIWKTAMQAIRSHPVLGVGLGNFHWFIQQHPPKGLAGGIPPMAHNLYLEWGADLGIGGILAAFWLQWRWVVSAVRAIRQRAAEADPYWFAVAVGALGTVSAFVVHNWVDFLIDHGVIIPMLLALGMVAAMAPEKEVRGDGG